MFTKRPRIKDHVLDRDRYPQYIKGFFYLGYNGVAALVIFPRPQVVNYLFDNFGPPYRVRERDIAFNDATAAAGRMLLSSHDHRHALPTQECW